MIEERKNPIALLNYGCSANRAIAEGLIGKLQRNGYTLTESIEESKVIIVNTCVVKQNTEHRMKDQLLSLSKTKEIIVTGCFPVVMREWILKNIPQVKILFPEAANQIIDLLEGLPVEETMIDATEIWSQLYTEDRYRFNPVISITEISRGCMGSCAFCIVRAVKGKLRSRKPEAILGEIKRALKEGSKEIWLTSQDTGAYGWDFSPEVYLPTLIDLIAHIERKFFLRLGMMTPSTLKRFYHSLVRQLCHPNVFSFLHLPIQSGSDLILRSMHRKENRSDFIDLIHQLHQDVNDLVIATDIIVGFPGERESDFEATMTLLQEVNPTIVNISRYTDRSGTVASSMSSKISNKIKAKRSKKLSKFTREITQNQLKKWLGWEGPVLIDEYGKYQNQFIGRNPSYLPVVIEGKHLKLGQFLEIRITDIGPTYLFGEIKKILFIQPKSAGDGV